MSDELVKPSDLRQEAERLIAADEMPALEEVLSAVAEARAKYCSLILTARREDK